MARLADDLNANHLVHKVGSRITGMFWRLILASDSHILTQEYAYTRRWDRWLSQSERDEACKEKDEEFRGHDEGGDVSWLS